MSRTAATVLTTLALALTTGPVGCKRTLAPKVAEVWDDTAAVGEAEALASLSPPWGSPTRAVLDSGLITFWLHEPDTAVSHLRLLLPIGDAEPLQSAAVVAVLQAHLLATLGSRGRSRAISVEARFAPDRIELVLHAPATQTGPAIATLATVMGARAPAAGLEAARGEVLERMPNSASPDERATAALVGALLGRAPTEQGADRAEVAALTGERLLEGWETLVDPRRAVLVVHAGEDAEPYRGTLRQLAERWRGRGRGPVPASALERLRSTPAPPTPTA
ncbi:MAG: hypothetical protein AB1Z98_14310, partial [Nannocystaceae bacterium]